MVAASHGGAYPGYLAAAVGVAGALLNNAGIGKDNAGIAALPYLDDLGIPAAAVDHESARIGDGADMMQHGVLSHVNDAASKLGCTSGMQVSEAAALLANSPAATISRPTPYPESRTLVQADGAIPIVCIDSISLLAASDANTLVVAASHGGMLASSRSDSVGIPVRAVAFHDAGGGKDDAGYGRLASLQSRGIAALTVAAHSARIGDAISCYHDGVISRVNEAAEKLGARIGQALKSFYTAQSQRD